MATSSVDLSVSGLASGMDWKSLVSQLADVERAPEKQLQTEQTTLQQRNSAYKTIGAELSSLNDKVKTLKDASLYGKRTAESSDATAATATADTGAAAGTYSFDITQLAKSSAQKGATGVAGKLNSSNDVSGLTLASAGFGTAVTAGTMTIDGKKVTVDTSKSLQDLFNSINLATEGAVTAAYDSATDKITLSSESAIVLGSSTDTSNFFQAAKLNDNNAQTLSSSAAVGGIRRDVKLSSANFATPIDDAGKGKFSINGVTITFSKTADTAQIVLDRINNSDAGVSASFDSSKGQFTLTNKSTGDMGISLEDVSGNFLEATGLRGGTLSRGQNLIYTVNDGGQLVSQSNTITGDSSGIAGLSVTALKASTVSVTVTNNTESVNTAINDFVTEYNKVQSMVDSYTASSTDSAGKVTAGILADESDATEIASSLRTLTYKPSTARSSAISSLDDLGVTTSGNDNKLTVSDATKLSGALADNLNKVQDLFTGASSGIATKLANYLNKVIGDEGSLPTKEATLTKQASDIDKQIADLERQVESYSDNLTQEFVSMEATQQNLKTQLSYLQQNLGTSTSSKSS